MTYQQHPERGGQLIHRACLEGLGHHVDGIWPREQEMERNDGSDGGSGSHANANRIALGARPCKDVASLRQGGSAVVVKDLLCKDLGAPLWGCCSRPPSRW